jgi:hypothetical protein
MKIMKLFFTIIVIVYFLGLGFLMYCNATEDIWPADNAEDSFISNFKYY